MTPGGLCPPHPLRFIRWEVSGFGMGSDRLPLPIPFYLTACVWSLLSVALFGCVVRIPLIF